MHNDLMLLRTATLFPQKAALVQGGFFVFATVVALNRPV